MCRDYSRMSIEITLLMCLLDKFEYRRINSVHITTGYISIFLVR